ncbi:MAG: thioredoxin domain-containing protein [Candidatus Saccharimonadales bacterium]
MDKKFLAIIGAIILVFIGIAVFNGMSKDDKNSGTEAAQASNHTLGAGTAKVTLVEYGDFECPACETYYPVLKEVKDFYGDKITFQFRNYPLTSIHKNAYAAARAAEAASLQGKFWEMHDALYEPANWQVWTSSSDAVSYFETYAKQLGLNVEQFKTDAASDKVNKTIRADMAEGDKINVTSTPTFVLNGTKITSPGATVDAFKQLIDAEIAKQASS